MVNEIICFFKNTRAEEFVNDGIYKATVYADECETVSAASSSAGAAAPKKGASLATRKAQQQNKDRLNRHLKSESR